MMWRTVVALICVSVLLSGCGDSSYSADSEDTGARESTPSPSGRLKVDGGAGSKKRMLIKTADGKTIGSIPEALDIEWRKDESAFAFTADQPSGLFVYDIGKRGYRKVPSAPVHKPIWSDDGRYLIATGDAIPPDAPSNLKHRGGPLYVWDATKDFRSVMSVGGIQTKPLFSPSSTMVASIAFTKDEAGEYARQELRVTDIGARKTWTLMSSRRRISFIWCGPNLAVASNDKYARPRLDLVSTSGAVRELDSSREYARMKPLSYDAKTGVLTYEAMRYPSLQPEGDRFIIMPGGAPTRIGPKDSTASPLSISEGVRAETTSHS